MVNPLGPTPGTTYGSRVPVYLSRTGQISKSTFRKERFCKNVQDQNQHPLLEPGLMRVRAQIQEPERPSA
jgi:hypothetical protein